MIPKIEPRTGSDEPPPFLGTWGRVYWMVVIYLALVIAGLSWFSLLNTN